MITVGELTEAFSDLKESDAELIVSLIAGDTEIGIDGDERLPQTSAWIRQCYNMPSADELTMSAINELTGGFGVEALFHPNNSSELIATYVNQGDTYAGTVVHDEDSGEYTLTDYGTFMEGWEAEECEENDSVSCGYCSHLTPIQNEEWSTTVCESCGRCVSTGELPEDVEVEDCELS
jgi:hypothetical protein